MPSLNKKKQKIILKLELFPIFATNKIIPFVVSCFSLNAFRFQIQFRDNRTFYFFEILSIMHFSTLLFKEHTKLFEAKKKQKKTNAI